MVATPYVLSNSEIQTFKDCRRKWWLTYYRRLKPRRSKTTGPLVLGSRIHEALDQHYTTGEALDEIYGRLVTDERAALTAAGQSTFEYDSEAELGRIMLEGYSEWADAEGFDAEYELVDTEQILTMSMFDGQVELQGKIDMRIRRKADGVILIRDWKTSANFNDFLSTAHINEQLLTYLTLEAANKKPGEPRSMGGLFTMFKKVKRSSTARPPFYMNVEINHNDYTLRSFWKRLHGEVGDLMDVKEHLDNGADHQQVAYPRPSRDCTWKCPFFSVCPLLDDGSAAEAAIEEQYEEADPYAYYGVDEKKGDA